MNLLTEREEKRFIKRCENSIRNDACTDLETERGIFSNKLEQHAYEGSVSNNNENNIFQVNEPNLSNLSDGDQSLIGVLEELAGETDKNVEQTTDKKVDIDIHPHTSPVTGQ